VPVLRCGYFSYTLLDSIELTVNYWRSCNSLAPATADGDLQAVGELFSIYESNEL
jgi:hypothetical protein